jgi:hypothetical protein
LGVAPNRIRRSRQPGPREDGGPSRERIHFNSKTA